MENKNILFLDFETQDDGIKNGLGAGWPYKGMVRFLGYAFRVSSGPSAVRWSTNVNLLTALIADADVLVAHNADYELGIMEMLGIDTKHLLIIDTMHLAILHDNRRREYGLDPLSKDYLGDAKTQDRLVEAAKELKLVKSKVQDAVKIAKGNLGLIYDNYPGLVEEYCVHDVELTEKLYNFYYPIIESSPDLLGVLSDLVKCVIKVRKKGVLVDTKRFIKSKEKIEQDLSEVEHRLNTEFLHGANPSSDKQLAAVFDRLGIPYPRTEKGNPSFKSKWFEDQDNELCRLLAIQSKLSKLKTSFINNIEQMCLRASDVSDISDLETHKLHPELNVLGARNTGRFTSTSFNMQQLPKRDPYSKPLIRSFIVPNEGHTWVCLDFSAQESRLQVHYAARIGSDHGFKMASLWNQDPKYDMHQAVADMCSITRTHAKEINLGLSYGMGIPKLSVSLKLPLSEARKVVKRYHENAPYLKQLINTAKSQLLKNGSIKTLLGRRLYKPESFYEEDTGRENDYSYKAVNMLIQGSAADQTIAAMVSAYRNGIEIGYTIHDEMTLQAPDTLTIYKAHYIMENCCKLLVPTVSEITTGPSFADQEDFTGQLTEEEALEFERFKNEYKPIVIQNN